MHNTSLHLIRIVKLNIIIKRNYNYNDFFFNLMSSLLVRYDAYLLKQLIGLSLYKHKILSAKKTLRFKLKFKKKMTNK